MIILIYVLYLHIFRNTILSSIVYMTSKSRSRRIISLKDVLESSEHPGIYYSTNPLSKRIHMIKQCLLGIQKSMGILQNPKNWFTSYNSNTVGTIKNIIYFLNYFTLLWFCCNHIHEILSYLQEHECEYEQSEYIVSLTLLKNEWEAISFQDLNPILEIFLNKIQGLNERPFKSIFHQVLLNRTRELYNIGVANVSEKIFMNNNSTFIINLKYNHTYISAINDVDTFKLSEIVNYIHENETKIKQCQYQINSLFENLGKIETLDQKCQKTLSKHPKLFMKRYYSKRLHMDQYTHLIEIIFKKLLSGKKSLSLPRKEKNITLRQTRSYGGSKRKSRKSKIH